MGGREITAERRAWLVGELEAWTGLGLVSQDQAKQILGVYPGGTPQAEAARRDDRASTAVMGLGALLIGLAVFTAVAFNWSELTPPLRLVLIFGTLIGTYAGAWRLYSQGATTTAGVVTFLGCLFFGAAIWLVAQTYNVVVSDSSGYWWWAIGVLPFALILGTWPLHALTVAALGLYTGTAALAPVFGSMTSWRYPPGPSWIIPTLAAAGLAWAYAHRSRSVLALYATLTTFWIVAQPTVWTMNATPIYWAGLVGSVLILLAECHPREGSLGIPWRFLGVVLAGGALIPLSTFAFNDMAKGEVSPLPLTIEAAAAVVLAVILLVFAADRDRRRNGGAESLAVWMLAAPGRWFPALMLGLFALLGFWNVVAGEPISATIAANAAMASLAIWLTVVGAREDRGRPFAAGVAYFLLWAVCRYVDLFSGFGGMPGAALMFLACGGALVAASLLWRRLKEVRHVHA